MALMKRRDSSILSAISWYLLPAEVFSTKSKFHACSLEISAYPPEENARSILRVCADWWYASSIRLGSWMRLSDVKSSPLIISPLLMKSELNSSD